MMTNFINIHLTFGEESSTITLLERFFLSPFFIPISIGSLSRYDWFLSGYALENFVAIYNNTTRKSPSSIKFSAENSEMESYLQKIANDLNQNNQISLEMSPFEETSEAYGFSFFKDSIKLDIHILESLNQWSMEFPKVETSLFGYINLAVQKSHSLLWSRSFRKLYPQSQTVLGEPLVWVNLVPLSKNGFDLLISAKSTVWLYQQYDSTELISKKEADENLAKLASLTKLAAGTNCQEINLRLKGKAFREESSRILSAFSDLDPITLTIE